MTSSSPTPPVLSRVDPVDVLAYLWSLKKFIPVGILVGAAVMAAMILPNRDSGAQLSAVSVQTNVRVQTADTMGAGNVRCLGCCGHLCHARPIPQRSRISGRARGEHS